MAGEVVSTRLLLQVVAVAVTCVAMVVTASAQGSRASRKAPDTSFRDCPNCPLMVRVPAGEFMMGSPAGELRRNADEGPQRRVSIAPFALSRHEITFAEWDQCVAKGGCGHKPSDEGWGRGKRPVVNISHADAVQYVTWLASATGQPYRLPSEAEWEYAARAASGADAPSHPFSTGATITWKQANFDANFVYGPGRIGIYRQQTVDVGSLPRNKFGLHEMHGNVWEWVQDCYKPGYDGAPADGSPVVSETCGLRLLRGGAWNYYPWMLRSACRYATPGDVRLNNVGLRVARSLAAAEQAQPVQEGQK